MVALLVVVGNVAAKDIAKWKSNQFIDNESAGAPRDEDILNTEELQAELIMEYLPFKMPFKVDKVNIS